EGRTLECGYRDILDGDRGRYHVDFRTDLRSEGVQEIEIEAVERCGVSSQHRRHLVLLDPRESGAQCFHRVREASFSMRVVASPHDSIDADLVSHEDLVRSDEARTEMALAGPVLTRLQGEFLDDRPTP